MERYLVSILFGALAAYVLLVISEVVGEYAFTAICAGLLFGAFLVVIKNVFSGTLSDLRQAHEQAKHNVEERQKEVERLQGVVQGYQAAIEASAKLGGYDDVLSYMRENPESHEWLMIMEESISRLYELGALTDKERKTLDMTRVIEEVKRGGLL